MVCWADAALGRLMQLAFEVLIRRASEINRTPSNTSVSFDNFYSFFLEQNTQKQKQQEMWKL